MTRKSTGRDKIELNGGQVAWRSFRQHCLAGPSPEAKYLSLAMGIQGYDTFIIFYLNYGD